MALPTTVAVTPSRCSVIIAAIGWMWRSLRATTARVRASMTWVETRSFTVVALSVSCGNVGAGNAHTASCTRRITLIARVGVSTGWWMGGGGRIAVIIAFSSNSPIRTVMSRRLARPSRPWMTGVITGMTWLASRAGLVYTIGDCKN